MSSSRRNSLLRLNKNSQVKNASDSVKSSGNQFYDYEEDIDAEQNINNPFSSSQSSPSTSKWSLNESWRKLQQIIENKDKAINQNAKKETNSQELDNFFSDDTPHDTSDLSIHEGQEIDEGYLNYVEYSDLIEDSIKNATLGSSMDATITSDSNIKSTNDPSSIIDVKNESVLKTSKTSGDVSSTSSETSNQHSPTSSSITHDLPHSRPTSTVISSEPLTTITTSQTIAPSSAVNAITTSNASDVVCPLSSPISKDNRRDETKSHTFLFSKMKKNCSIEKLDEDVENNETNRDEHRNLFNDRFTKIDADVDCTRSNQTKSHALTLQNTRTFNKSTPIRTQTKSSSPFSGRSSTLKNRNSICKFQDLNEESSIDTSNISYPSLDRSKTSKNSSSSSSNNSMLKNKVSIDTPLFRKQHRRTPSTIINVDEPIPSLNNFTSYIVNFFRERLNLSSFTYSLCTFFILIFAIQLSPLSSFANGFLIGIVFSFLFLVIVLVYALNYVFQKIDFENDLHNRILTGKRWQNYPAYRKINEHTDDRLSATNNTNQQQTGIHEGWFFELVYSKKLGVDRMTAVEKCDYEKMPETKLQLAYIKLENTIMRVYVPKPDQSKKINVDKVNFLKVSNKMNQQNYDFSKMKSKRIQLWLPKNIINKKKYLWSRKFPFILTIEETNKLSENKRTPFNLFLFCRTNRDKEEWYSKFRHAIEMADQNLSINHLITAASTPDEVTHEQEQMPRARSLDIGNISYEFEHLSNFLSYETFIQDLISQNIYSLSGAQSSSGGQPSSVGAQFGNNINNNNFNGNNNNNQNNDQQSNSNLFWFNALVGRVFFDFLTHPHWTKWVQLKIQRKLTRIKLPYFIQTIILKDVNLGSSMPRFLSVANNPIIDEKGIWIDFELDYRGCFSMTLETKLDLMKLKETKAPERELKPLKSPTRSTLAFDSDDLSDPESIVSLSDDDCEENLSIENDARQGRFVKLLDKLVVNKYFQQATDSKFLKKKMEEVSNLPILFTVNIYKLKGVLTVNLPPAPTDRLWYGFRSISDFQLECKPSFGERSIQLNPIIQILSKKLKQEFHKILVLPNLDDIVLGNVMIGHEDILDNILDGEMP